MLGIFERQRFLIFAVIARRHREVARYQIFSDSAEGLGHRDIVGVQCVRECCGVVFFSIDGAGYAISRGDGIASRLIFIFNHRVARANRQSQNRKGLAMLQSECCGIRSLVVPLFQGNFSRGFLAAGIRLHRFIFYGLIVLRDRYCEQEFLLGVDVVRYHRLGDVQIGRITDIGDLTAVTHRLRIVTFVSFRNLNFLNGVFRFFIINISRKSGISDRVGVVFVISDGQMILVISI